jgi:hypothetical protein
MIIHGRENCSIGREDYSVDLEMGERMFRWEDGQLDGKARHIYIEREKDGLGK